MSPEPAPDSDSTLVNRYLAHQLSDAERTLLEAELVIDAGRASELEATARFKVGLQRLRETGELDELLRPPRRSYQPWAIAAAAAVILGALVFTLRSFDTAVPVMLAASLNELADRDGRLPPTSPIQRISRVRADAGGIVVRLPAARQALRLRIFPTAEVLPPYTVALLDGSSDVLGETTVRDFEEDGFITVFLDSARVPIGEYVLQLRGAVEDRRLRAEEFPFSIQPAAVLPR